MAPATVQERLDACSQRLQEMTVKFGLGELSASTYLRLRAQIEAQIAGLESALLDDLTAGPLAPPNPTARRENRG